MNNEFFNRVACVTIGTPAKQGGLSVGIAINSPMRITFDVQKSEFSLMNTATITINNLQDSTRNLIRNDGSLVVQLEAGYVDNGGLQLVFFGNIVDVSHNVKKPEIVTTIIAQDGHNAIKKNRISVSYPANTSILNIIKNAVKGLNLPLNAAFNYAQIDPTITMKGSYAFCGNASSLLDKICNDNNLQWSVQNHTIKIYQAGTIDNQQPMSTFLIGSPRRLFKNMLNMSLNDFSGYEFECALAPVAEPGRGVTITSREIKNPTTLCIADVKHEGDTHGERWTTTIKAKDINK